jgi:hypothetical protein
MFPISWFDRDALVSGRLNRYFTVAAWTEIPLVFAIAFKYQQYHRNAAATGSENTENRSDSQKPQGSGLVRASQHLSFRGYVGILEKLRYFPTCQKENLAMDHEHIRHIRVHSLLPPRVSAPSGVGR